MSRHVVSVFSIPLAGQAPPGYTEAAGSQKLTHPASEPATLDLMCTTGALQANTGKECVLQREILVRIEILFRDLWTVPRRENEDFTQDRYDDSPAVDIPALCRCDRRQL